MPSIEIGHFAFALAIGLAAAQAGLGFWRWQHAAPARLEGIRAIAILQFLLIALAFASLIAAFVASDFSLKLAFENSHSLQPLIYKVTSVWGNHEGSMLLWVLILAVFGGAVAVSSRRLPDYLASLVLAFQGVLVLAFGAFTIATSNPFLRIANPPLDGRDLNPILQDIGLAIHPPLLYLGYVGFSVCFSFAMAALVSGRIDAAWARWVRPWTLTSWVFLTLGIAMGSYWAYYELGWGGFWFWDPVENASFMPWLAGTALLHSALVMEKRDALKIWTILLAILTFSLSLLGTFLVRSGILTSVHSFASDPTRGLVILAILAAVIGGALALFGWRAPSLKAGGLFAPVSREGALVVNNLFLATATLAVMIGTLYPLVLDAVTGDRISVGPPFFNLTFGAIMVLLLSVVPFGPRLAWKRADLAATTKRLFGAMVLAMVLAVIVSAYLWRGPGLAPLGYLIGFWAIAGALADLWARADPVRNGPALAMRRLAGLPRTAFATALAHLGLGVTTLGIVAVSATETERIVAMQPGDLIATSGYEVRYEGAETVPGPNYTAEQFTFRVSKEGWSTLLAPERRTYEAARSSTTEAAIETRGLSQVYISIGDENPDGSQTVRVWYKPYVTLIWFGALIMAAGGALSLTDRRLRVGVAQRSARGTARGTARGAA